MIIGSGGTGNNGSAAMVVTTAAATATKIFRNQTDGQLAGQRSMGRTCDPSSTLHAGKARTLQSCPQCLVDAHNRELRIVQVGTTEWVNTDKRCTDAAKLSPA